MTLTPADIHNAEFGKASFGRRGYDEDDVDSLLDEVTQEMISLLEQNNALQSRLDEVGPTSPVRPDGAAAQLSSLTAELGDAQRACERAEQHARQAQRQLAEARRAADTSAAARTAEPSEPVLRMAQRTADGYLHEAQGKSETLLAEAQERANRTLHEARDAADAIKRKSQRHQDEAAAELAAGRASITRDIDELAQLIGHYRAGLADHLRHQGDLINGPVGPDPQRRVGRSGNSRSS
jgi:DivIVA domain-containing protein